MIVEHTKFSFNLYKFAGLCMPCNFQSLYSNYMYYVYMILTDLFVAINLITIGVKLISPNVLLAERCLCAFTSISTTHAILKSLYCYIQRKKFSTLLKMWDNSFENDYYSKDLIKLLETDKKKVKKIICCVSVLMLAPMIPWGGLPLFVEGFSYFIPQLRQERFIAVPSWHPYDHFKSPGFEITGVLQALGALWTNAKVVAFDCLLYGLLSRQIVQYRHLKNNMNKITSNIQVRYDGHVKLMCTEEIKFKRFFKKDKIRRFLKKELCLWIRHHQELIRLGQLVQQIYSPMLLLQFFCQLLMLCSNAFVVTAAPLSKLELAFCSGYVIGNILQLLILCYFGETLIIESKGLLDDGFGKGWYACPPELRSIFKVLFQRIQTPFKISAIGVFPLSIETFRSIIGTAFSYLMVLRSLKKG